MICSGISTMKHVLFNNGSNSRSSVYLQNGEPWSTSLASTTTSAFTATCALHVPKSKLTLVDVAATSSFLDSLPVQTSRAHSTAQLFSDSVFRDKYCKGSSPLAFCGSPQQTAAAPDFKDWHVTIAETALKEFPHLATIAPDGFRPAVPLQV